MDELILVERLRAEVPPPTDLTTARARLMAGMSAPADAVTTEPGTTGPAPAGLWRRTRRAFTISSVRWALLAGGLAGAVAIGVVGVDLGGDSSVPTRRTPVQPPVRPVANVSTLLDRAALAAESGPTPRPDQYVFTHTKTWSLAYYTEEAAKALNARKGWSGHSSNEDVDWRAVDGSKPGLTREKHTSSGPSSPPSGDAPVPGQPGWTQRWACDRAMRIGEMVDLRRPPAGCTTRPGYRDDLPTEPDAMLAYLSRTRGDGPKTEATWENVLDLLHSSGHIPPKSRAALFRALKKLKEGTLVRDSVNAAGRHGIAVAVKDGFLRVELIFDPRSYEYIGSREVLAKDHGGKPAGTRIGAEAIVRTGFVDRLGEVPRR